jgi:formate hydrogenlyase subunit 6/NADH:ubiquinone oxidoreductase subunit I
MERAAARGLVDLDIGKIAVYGDPFEFTIPNCELMPRTEITSIKNARGVSVSLMRMVLKRRPEVKRDACVGCAECAKLCPAKAIEMKSRLPIIDRKKCIRCFCCQEFCPKGAMRVHRTAIAKLLNR